MDLRTMHHLLTTFYARRTEVRLSNSAGDMFGYLLYAALADGNRQVRRADAAIMAAITISRNTLKRAREELRRHGFIEFEPAPQAVYQVMPGEEPAAPAEAEEQDGADAGTDEVFQLEYPTAAERPKRKKAHTKPIYTPQDVEAIYDAFPRKYGRQRALREIEKAISKEGKAVAFLMQKTQEYAEAVATWPKQERKFVLSPAKFFADAHYDDDPREWSTRSRMGGQRFRADPGDNQTTEVL
jgi:hypothetical protein